MTAITNYITRSVALIFLCYFANLSFAQQKEKGYLYFDTTLMTKGSIQMSVSNYDGKTNKLTYCYIKLNKAASEFATRKEYDRSYFGEFDKKKYRMVDSNYVKRLNYLKPECILDKGIDFGSDWDKRGNIITVLGHVPTYKKLFIIEKKGANLFKIIQVVPVTALIEE